jgi:hypothetical protein
MIAKTGLNRQTIYKERHSVSTEISYGGLALKILGMRRRTLRMNE